MRLAAGTRLGSYELMALVGSGGAGEVWTARDVRTDQIVAIKRLHGAHLSRFRVDAGPVADLRHPHICSILEVGPDYLVMEYVEGPTLRGPVAPNKATRLAIQLVSAIEAAHARGILHGDLKPGNVIVTRDSAKLLDFGVARLRGAETDANTPRSTAVALRTGVAYLSPEQAQGRPLDARSDIFSFGALLYEMLSGHRAFTGGSSADVMRAVLHDEPQSFAMPDALARVVQGCLKKNPEDRFQTMSDVRKALESFAATNP